MLDDKRLVKMILETAQLLATAVNLNGGQCTYKTTHKNHPCSIWARAHRGNYLWLMQLFGELNKEYTFRFNKTHKSFGYWHEFDSGQYFLEDSKIFDKHPNCTKFKEVPDVYKAYEICMVDKWKNDKRTPKWTNRQAPSFYGI
jgi:hypothetical protein